MAKSKKSKYQKFKLTPTVQLISAMVLFIAATLASRSQEISQWELWLFRAVYNLPQFLHSTFVFITQFGSIYMLGLLAVFFLLRRHYHILLRLLMTGTLAYTATGVAKDLWGRIRPHELLSDVVSLEYVVRGPGFPSGHTALAAALALTLGYYWHHRYKWVVVALIVGVSLSRIYLGVHLPLDIVGGFAIGWASYALFRHVRLQDVLPKHKRGSL